MGWNVWVEGVRGGDSLLISDLSRATVLRLSCRATVGHDCGTVIGECGYGPDEEK